MAWLFQGVLNAGLQILLSIFGGWLCARLRLVDPEVMSRNVNLFAMKAAYPAFIIHLLGVKTDLRDGLAWKALGVFVLWVFIIHVCCCIFYKLRGKRSNVLQLGLNCLLLSTNNTGCIGWPVLIATVGQQSAVLSMLLGVLFFIQLLPVTICCFEYYKWQQTEVKQVSTAASNTSSKGDLHTGDQLHDTDQQLALPATEFPHEFRYCYWSNELYQPSKPSPYALLPEHAANAVGATAAAAAAQHPLADLAQVCVESGDDTDEEAAEHPCFGGGSAPSATRSRDPSYSSNNSSSNAGGTAAAPGREWWRAGRPSKQQPGGLKRAKDSCDSLYTPFAAAAASAKQAEEQQQQQQAQRPSTMGLSSLTRRLSRGLSAAGAGVAAAAAAAVASPRALAHAASLHTAASLTKAAAPLKRAASGKPQASSLRRQPGGQDPFCQMSIPLMEEHSDEPLSCCPSHLVTASQPTSPRADSAAAEGAASSSGAAAGAVNGLRSRDSSRRCSSSSIGVNSSSGGASGRVTRDCVPTAVPAAAAPSAAAGAAVAGKQSRLPGWAGQQPAADSAVELHFMCETMVAADSGKHHAQEQQQQGALQASAAPAAAAAAAAGVLGGSGHWSAQMPSSSSAISLHTMGRDDSCGRFNSDTGRISSRTNLLLPCGGINSSSSGDGGRAAAAKGASKLGRAARASNAGGAGVQAQPKQQQQKPNIYRRFVQQHPLLCHIVWNQMQSLHLWLNVLAIALSVSGARKYLDPQSPQAIPALGFVDGVLSWFSAACIPTLLFANGVWMCGKNVWQGGLMGQLQVLSILLLKLTLLPALMVGLTLLCNIRGAHGLSLVLLASCPLAPLAFLVCQQYGFGAELSTSITIQGVLLMLPQMMAVIKVNQLAGLYDVDLVGA